MPTITVANHEIDVDIIEELSQFDWHRPRWSSDKLIAGSPFREDYAPSFFVALDGEYAGCFGDSGAHDSDYASGSLPKLLAYLRNETYEEACEYLLAVYAPAEADIDEPLPTFSEVPAKQRIDLPESTLEPYKYRHKYLENRGISEAVQRFAGVGYDKSSRAITLPWRHADGTLANVKYRKVADKTFWYRRNSAPVRSLVYGIDKAYARGWTEVVVCEAEIDALSWLTAGKPAIAIGGVSVSRTQLDLIKRSPIESVIISPDNDRAGAKLSNSIADGLRGYVALSEVRMPAGFKDANEALVAVVELSELPVCRIKSLSVGE